VAKSVLAARHLVVLPVRDLGTAPWPLLEAEPGAGPLVESASVTVAPDLLALLQPVAPWAGRATAPVIVGDPALPPDEEWELPPLAGAEREARRVGELLGAAPLVGAAATAGEVESRAEEGDLLYVASHGVADAERPLHASFLALAADEAHPDGRWTAREIQAARLAGTRLAVLSACQTGLGQAHDGGVIGLARAFRIAGVPRVVMSLWSVEDEATAQLMERFVAELGETFPAEALRRAMLAQREQDPDPARWASFVLFGTPR